MSSKWWILGDPLILLHQAVIVAMIYVTGILIVNALLHFLVDAFLKLIPLVLGHHVEDLAAWLFILLKISDQPLLLFDGVLVLSKPPLNSRDLSSRWIIKEGHGRRVTQGWFWASVSRRTNHCTSHCLEGILLIRTISWVRITDWGRHVNLLMNFYLTINNLDCNVLILEIQLCEARPLSSFQK